MTVATPGNGWILTGGRVPDLAREEMIFAYGRMGDVFGPMPFELINEEAWRGNMFHASHDLTAYLPVNAAKQDATA